MVSETIEFVLWYEREIYIALADKGEGNRQGGTTGGNGSGHMKVSDPTAVQALRNLQEINVLDVPYGAAIGLNKRWQETYRLRNPLKWLQVGKALKQHYLSDTNSLHEFFERRYIKKEDWKQTCKEHFDENKKKLLSHINELLENQFKCDFKMNKNDIMHIALPEINSTMLCERM